MQLLIAVVLVLAAVSAAPLPQQRPSATDSRVNGDGSRKLHGQADPRGYAPGYGTHAEGDVSHHKVRRDVPVSSYGRFGEGQKTAYGSAPILEQTDTSNPDGSFSNSYKTGNGISSETRGYQKKIGPNEEGQAMEGEYSYTSPDGTPVTNKWFADETGFHSSISSFLGGIGNIFGG